MLHAYRCTAALREAVRYKTATAPAQGQAAGQASGGAGAKAAPVMNPWPFPVGVLDTQNASDYNETVTMGASASRFPDVKVEPDGWLRGLWFDIAGVVTGNTSTVTFAGDTAAGTGAPFSAINTVLFRDTGGEQIFGPFNGFDWENTNKFGAYHAQGDPRADLNYSTTNSSSATGAGSFHYTLYLPLEISAADALGDVENRSENSIYRVELTLEQSSVVYTTAPSSLPVVTIMTTQDSYTEPVAAMALSGRPVSSAPPSPGTLQYWKQEDDTMPGTSSSTLITNGIGNGYRNIIFKLIRSSGTRANGQSDWPSPIELTLGTSRVRNLYIKPWMDKAGRAFQLTSATADTANGWENGVFPMWFTQDVGIKPGDEARRKYLRTKTGNTFKVRGTFANAGTLYITSNYLVPRNNDFSQIVA
jgi:hypothetical protein